MQSKKPYKPGFGTALLTAIFSILLVLGAILTSLMETTPPRGEFSYYAVVTAAADGEKFTYKLTYNGDSFGTVYFSVGDDFSIPVSLQNGDTSESFEVYNPANFGDLSITLTFNGAEKCIPVDPAGPFPQDDGSNIYTVRFDCSNP